MGSSTKRLMFLIVAVAAIAIIYWVGFGSNTEQPKQPANSTPAQTEKTGTPGTTPAASQPAAGGDATSATNNRGRNTNYNRGMSVQAAELRPDKAQRLLYVADLESQLEALKAAINASPETDAGLNTTEAYNAYNQEQNAISQFVTILNDIRPLNFSSNMGGRGGGRNVANYGGLTSDNIRELIRLATDDTSDILVARLNAIQNEATAVYAGGGSDMIGGFSRGGVTIIDNADPCDPLVRLSLNNLTMNELVTILMDWTGMPIIPTGNSMAVRLTVYAPNQVKKSKALQLIYAALREQGYGIQKNDTAIYIRLLSEMIKYGPAQVQDIAELSAIENQEEMRQMIFTLKNYTPSQIGQILQPLMGSQTYATADEISSTLTIMDTVRNLKKYAQLINMYDVKILEGMEQEIIRLKYRSPTEIVSLLQTLMASNSSTTTGMFGGRGGGPGGRGGGATTTAATAATATAATAANPRGGRNAAGMTTSSNTPTTASVGTGRTAATLVADATNNCIIAKALPEDMEEIHEWIKMLDIPVITVPSTDALETMDPIQKIQYTFKLDNTSASTMASLITPLLNQTGGYYTADDKTGTLLVIDTVANLISLRDVIKTFDVPEALENVYQIFEVKNNADPVQIVQMIQLLLNTTSGTGTATTGRVGTTTGRTGTTTGRTGTTTTGGRTTTGGGRTTTGGGRTTTGKGACFLPDTPIWADGAYVQISKVTVGQIVGQSTNVKQLMQHQVSSEVCRDIELTSGNHVRVVDAHRFMLASGLWISAEDLQSGMTLKTMNGTVGIKSITTSTYTGKVYNVQVDTHQYMVGSDALIVRDW
jgi:type II secretory pathway component GspD/PulD (secretin)